MQGFAATLQPDDGFIAVTQSVEYTYNQHGQELTRKDARSNVTTRTYYSDTTPDHTKGDLWKVANARNHVTEYTKYNAHGQVKEVKDPNGVITSYTYDLRQRMTSVTQAGHQTVVEWWPTGLLKKVTQPDGSWLFYEYDDAHRLTDISDNLGNKVHYTLDNAGNRTNEQVTDTTGTLTRAIARTYDNLNRLWTIKAGVEQ